MSHQIPYNGKVIKYVRVAITEETIDTFDAVQSGSRDGDRLTAHFLFEEALYAIAEFYESGGNCPTGLIRLEVNPRGQARRLDRMDSRMKIFGLIEDAKKFDLELDPNASDDLPGDEWKKGGG